MSAGVVFVHGSEHCPDFLKNKWPASNQKGIKPIGEECPFAHHAFHIASKAFLKSNNRLKDQLIKKLKTELTNPATDADRSDWNPAGNPLSVSARYVNFKDARSSFQSANHLRMTTFNKRAEIQNQRLKRSAQVRRKMKEMKRSDNNYRQKMGYLNRAKVLYDKRRFKEAFETIIKAIAIVKKEDEDFEEDREMYAKKLKKQLDLSFDADLDEGVLLRMQHEIKKPKVKGTDGDDPHRANDRHDPLSDFDGIKFQKLVYFSEKVGLIGEKPVNVDQDLKDEIEEV